MVANGDEIANHSIMFDIGVEIGIKTKADADVRCEGHEGRQAGAISDHDLVHLLDRGRPRLDQTNFRSGAFLREDLASS